MPQPGRLRETYRLYPVYFITACTHRRRHLLDRSHVHQAFKTFAHNSPAYEVWVGRYVIMPDHLHLFAAFTADSPGLSAWMKSLKNYLSNSLRQCTVAAPHWQRGFHDHLMRSEESYDEKWNYVQMNPVRAGLVAAPEDWPYQGEVHRLSVRDDVL